jgi:hypothetical protein
MKKIKTISLVLALCAMNQMTNAQWVSKASGFATPQRGIQEMIAVNSNDSTIGDEIKFTSCAVRLNHCADFFFSQFLK